MPNINELHPLELREVPGFEARRGRLGWALGTERLGLGVWELAPGQAAYPYHFHIQEEEVLIVLEGTLSLRTPDGWRELPTGEAVRFPRGESGAHQVVNWGEQPARFLAISTSGDADICVYPDSDKVGAFERLPTGRGLFTMFRAEDQVDYHHGETPPARPVGDANGSARKA
jgi:uncharacterized cupin superfamily protein